MWLRRKMVAGFDRRLDRRRIQGLPVANRPEIPYVEK
jgi:hypothetical protein